MRPNSVLCFLFFLAPLLSISQKQHLKFQHLQASAGLSQSNVQCILQDSHGFMWFGTRGGLDKYDGYKFTEFKTDVMDSNSISNNNITAIIESKDGNLWIATWGGGLNCFNTKTNRFTRYTYNSKNANSIANNFVYTIVEDKESNLWIGTEAAGLNMFNPRLNKFINYRNNKKDSASISDDFVKIIYQDHENNLWIGTTNGGLNLYNRDKNNFKHFKHIENDTASLSDNSVYSLFEDSKKQLWIGTNGGGINVLNSQTNKFTHIKKNEKNSNNLSANFIYAINEDIDNNIWIGTENGGLCIFNPVTGLFSNYVYDEVDNTSLSNNSIYVICKSAEGNMWIGTFSGGVDYCRADNQFVHYKHTSLKSSLSSNNVLSIFEDHQKNIWIGTDGGGLNLFNTATGNFSHYKNSPGNKNSICGNYVLNVCEDSKHNLWIGTWGDGITVYNKEKNTYQHYKNNPADISSLSNNNAWTIYNDEDNNIWVGTYGGGLNRYNPTTNSFTRFQYNEANPSGINSDKIHSILDDENGNLLIGTDGGGLNIFSKKNGTFLHYLHNDAKNSIASNSVGAVYKDKKGIFWIATDAGLSMFNSKTSNFTTYTTTDGLPDNVIFGILQDDHEDLWISTNKGISRFNPVFKSFKNFDVVDGLQASEFKENAFCKSSGGAFYFGGNNGFNVFYPDSIKQNNYDPPLVFTHFRIFNKEVPVALNGKDLSPLKKDISETDTIKIQYDISVIQFEFASLNYTKDANKKYTYMLEGFDKDWTAFSGKHTATYTNLDPGTYTFKVKGLTNDGQVSSHILTMHLIVTPPYWLTWWFKLIAAFLVVGGYVSFYRYRINSINAQKNKLQRLVEERTQQLQLSTEQERKARTDAENANKAKSVFLATMSHELRTPMNGVIGMTSLLVETPLTDEQKEFASIIKTCGENLLNVINDILDFSKIESGNMELEYNNFDLHDCIEEVLDVFAEKASKTGLDLVYQIDYNVPVSVIGDRLRIRQILLNLVSNAIKFTKKGEVFVGVRLISAAQNGDIELEFEVKDTGIGIPADKLNKLFKAFSQVDSSTTRKYGGTGLGLVISEKLVTLMGGKIKVESKYKEGSTFTFNIPAKTSNQSVRTYVHSSMWKLEGKRVLVVDDNSLNSSILFSQLTQWKMIPVLAASGTEAINIASNCPPFHLLLTDMKMPGMDGVQLAQHFNNQYPGLPVILLSSVGDNGHKQYSKLFNAVLTKPIKQQILINAILDAFRKITKPTTSAFSVKQQTPEVLSAKYPMNILLAEDDIFNQMFAVQVLKNEGYNIHIAENGKQAVDMAQAQHFDLILMDVQMPEMDGFEATHIIRKIAKRQPVIIAMTANALQGDKEKCIAAGMDDYISKPISMEEFLQKIELWAAQTMKPAVIEN